MFVVWYVFFDDDDPPPQCPACGSLVFINGYCHECGYPH